MDAFPDGAGIIAGCKTAGKSVMIISVILSGNSLFSADRFSGYAVAS